MKKLLLLTFLFTGFLSSCGDEEITRDPATQGHLYYPLEVGMFWIFNVQENRFRNNTVDQTSSYQTRERIESIIQDQTGKEWYRVELSRRTSSSSTWVVNGVKLMARSATDLRVQEDSKTLVKMVYPVRNGYTFNSNAFVDAQNKVELTYVEAGQPSTVNGKTYENTVAVLLQDFEQVLDLNEHYDLYALGVGPVKRSTINYTYCNNSSSSSPCTVGTGFIVSGTDKTEVLDSTGKVN